MKPIRFRQSYAKTLLSDCPALLRLHMTQGRKTTRAMDAGSLLDYLVFEQDTKYEIVDARYKSGPRQGEPCTDWQGKEAQQARDEITGRGLLAVLDSEIDELQETATAIRARIVKLAAEMAGDYGHDILWQPHCEWTSALGIECEGTPDVVVLVRMRDVVKLCTIDVKHTAALQTGRFNRQVHDMGWDVQAAAYREAVVQCEEAHGPAFHLEHVILATSSMELDMAPVARRLSPAYMAIGEKRWRKAQVIWKECLDSDSWPGYPETDAEPSHYLVRTEIERESTFDSADEEP